jgi:protein-L-isoaspartate(D-aspartate) O-methyltransferase
MVEGQLRARGIKDERLLAAMEEIPRHLFVSSELARRSYNDCAFPIGEDQTISQPYMVALMTELLQLKGDERILEIGTGSGYQTALLSMLGLKVFSIERVGALAERAKLLLARLGYSNVDISVGDGTIGLPSEAPFDCIMVTAAAPDVPHVYMEQLAMEGRLVIPAGSRLSQFLYRFRKTRSGIEKIESTGCVFVPLLGKNGWVEK